MVPCPPAGGLITAEVVMGARAFVAAPATVGPREFWMACWISAGVCGLPRGGRTPEGPCAAAAGDPGPNMENRALMSPLSSSVNPRPSRTRPPNHAAYLPVFFPPLRSARMK